MSGDAESAAKKDTAGVILPPPVILLIAILAGFGLDYLWPRAFAPDWARFYLGPALIAGAIALAVAGERQFKRAGTSVKPWVPSTAIVTSGIFAHTRNPMYLAMAILLAGVGLLGDSFWFLAVIIGFVGVMKYGVILREEAYLERKFGTPYTDYKARVRRWI
ncbi:isoprenylcysteine carboxylmethyltransferase family protein [Nisaea acidiphila]|uniref:Isoprenylcysteine carboxylmethyltransferase family protein n=1 Tax=Nisaea acidiphila TaxID=1862145 RepID=A0A9J7AYQ6_9PROT|nr:isoprenylcysteine carboxylmethyltransferase family protein [Nisaea acidiphila]UUX51922.1 isoprenylcysteine carboxylmethyltransferase family protein [Nisaea acidiphila]